MSDSSNIKINEKKLNEKVAYYDKEIHFNISFFQRQFPKGRHFLWRAKISTD